MKANKESGIDENGNVDCIIPGHLVSIGDQSYNNIVVNVEKYTGPELLPDYMTASIVPLPE
jgi:hypothetical protein